MMEEIYTGYFPKTQKQVEMIWNKALFSFDANILLSFYDRSENSCRQIFEILDKLNNRLFLTHQAGLEYMRNRISVMCLQANRYADFVNKFSGIVKAVNADDKLPFFSSRTNKSINNIFKKVEKESRGKIELLEEQILSDPIYNEISRIFKGKIQSGYDAKQLSLLYKEGEERFSNKIPPGFKDQSKEDNTRYGDFIIWHQIIDKAKETSKPVIFVTNDLKSDWWWVIKGKTIGPRPELVGEIREEANVDFYMYGLDQFIKECSLYFRKRVNHLDFKENEEETSDEVDEEQYIYLTLSLHRFLKIEEMAFY